MDLADPGAAPAAGARLTFVGDVHGKVNWLSYVVRQARAAGSRLLVQVGDFGLWPGNGGRYFLNDVARLLAEYDAELVFIDGNHDDHTQRLAFVPDDDGLVTVRPRLRYAPRGATFEVDGLRFLAAGGAPSIDKDTSVPFVSWWPQETISFADAEKMAAAGHVDVVVAHDCPLEVPLPGMARWAEGDAHRRLMSMLLGVARPRWWFSGHYHKRVSAMLEHPGFSTRVEILDCDGSHSSGRGWCTVETAALRRRGDDPAVAPPAGATRRANLVTARR